VAGTASERQPRVVLPDGSHRTRPLADDEQVALWAHCLHHGAPGLVEVVAGRRRADGTLAMRSRSAPGRFPRAGDLQALVRMARRHREAGEEVFCTPLTRQARRSGKAGGILPGRVAWIDIDEPAALGRLRAFPHRPHLVAYSGSGGAHAYWRLASPLPARKLEAANRKLAAHLGGDLASTDRARSAAYRRGWPVNSRADGRPAADSHPSEAAAGRQGRCCRKPSRKSRCVIAEMAARAAGCDYLGTDAPRVTDAVADFRSRRAASPGVSATATTKTSSDGAR
jgi:hypothetical protein